LDTVRHSHHQLKLLCQKQNYFLEHHLQPLFLQTRLRQLSRCMQSVELLNTQMPFYNLQHRHRRQRPMLALRHHHLPRQQLRDIQQNMAPPDLQPQPKQNRCKSQEHQELYSIRTGQAQAPQVFLRSSMLDRSTHPFLVEPLP